TGVAGVKYYQLEVTDPNSDCSDPISEPVSVTVYPDATLSIAVDNQEVCVNGSATLTATLMGGSSQVSLQWQNSSNQSGPFAEISGETMATYQAPTSSAGT